MYCVRRGGDYKDSSHACSLATHLQRNVLESVCRTMEKLHDFHFAYSLCWHDVLGAKSGVTTLHQLPQILGRDLRRSRKQAGKCNNQNVFTLNITSSMCGRDQEDHDKKKFYMTFVKTSNNLGTKYVLKISAWI